MDIAEEADVMSNNETTSGIGKPNVDGRSTNDASEETNDSDEEDWGNSIEPDDCMLITRIHRFALSVGSFERLENNDMLNCDLVNCYLE